MAEQRDVVVIGSGAGGGIVATRLAELGRNVLLIESGSYHTAGEFTRWELGASRQLWNAPRFAQTRPDGSRPIAMVCGRSVGGTAGSTTLNRYIQQAMTRGQLDVLPDTRVTRIRTAVAGDGRREATGVEFTGPDGTPGVVESPVVVVAAGAMVTPQLLQLSGLDRLGTPSSALIGRTLGTHTARIVHGVFDEIVDAHVVYPITAHCRDFAADADGGFVVEAITVMDPIALASNLVEDDFTPMIGQHLVGTMNKFRHLAELFMMANDSNLGVVTATEDQVGQIDVPMPAEDEQRRMGSDPQRSVCNADQELWDVDGLYVGDSSVIPRTLTFNPSLTIMALAERLAHRIDANAGGRLPASSRAA